MISEKFEPIHTITAYLAIKEYLNNNSLKIIENKPAPEVLNKKRACFVTLKTDTKKLRGCIGTLRPAYKNLYIEIIRNAVAAATKDNRFEKVSLEELEKLFITVEVLSEPEKINDIGLLNPKKYGLIISDKYGNRGVLLPNIEGIDTVEKQINIVKRKAGISSIPEKNLTYYRFSTEKYS